MVLKRIMLCVLLSFRMMRVMFQLLYGAWRVSKLRKPVVSIFGGAQLSKDQIYFTQAHELAGRFVNQGISVLTGGGPGIMEAVSCGAEPPGPNKGKSIGIGVKDLGEGKNPCVQEYFELNYFFARKWLLTQYSSAFIVFPGGFGTLDELSEVLTLIKTKKMARVPIILIGKEFWEPFMGWITQEAIKHGVISERDTHLFMVTDNLEQAFCTVRDECKII